MVAVLTALDPVLVRYDRQDVIEPFALCISLLALHAAWHLRDRGALAYVSVTGLLGGLALLTNEITVFLIVVPLLFALLEGNRSLISRSAAALGIAVTFLLLFLLWAAELGLAGSFVNIQTTTLQRLIGLVQISGLNVPGVSLVGALGRSVTQYSSSYIVLAVGFAALVWCWTRRNTQSGNFLTAWLTASYASAGYIVAVGTLNEQFFVYLLPASIVGSVLLADALIAGWVQPRPRRHTVRRQGHPRGFPTAAHDRDRRLCGPGGPVGRQLGHQLQRSKRRRGARRPGHRHHASCLRRGQCQWRPGEVLIPAGGAQLRVLLGRSRGAR